MAALTTPTVDVRRAGDRLKTEIDWLDSKHSFSFGHHYDPDNTHHGLLLVNNDDTVRPGQGFDTHPHRDMEIVTWVLRGSLVHQDSMGHAGVIYPGLAQRMSAGTGILHSEKNDAFRYDHLTHSGERDLRPDEDGTDPVRFVQMWVVPDDAGATPGYEQLEIEDEILKGGLVPVASGRPEHRDHSAIRINNTHASLHVARLRPGAPVTVPTAPYVHVFVAQGSVVMEGVGALAEGDAVRLTASGGQQVSTEAGAEILVWEMHSRLGG
ncbi:pirin-like bicupin family protein [Rhodococcus sp. HNM0569]|uniref:pirin family protein n=1 Tax=Rhodococcus sp. HNM0569 TaxID=2716340 RepID=UPI00146DA620|nr:pirin-like bicupin family protein [Rhodococcus sp. HNM0569]NLU83734.1 pirin family protein [Rhodococcus sp. HNM0569]